MTGKCFLKQQKTRDIQSHAWVKVILGKRRKQWPTLKCVSPAVRPTDRWPPSKQDTLNQRRVNARTSVADGQPTSLDNQVSITVGLIIPCKHDSLKQCRFYVGATSKTAGHSANIGYRHWFIVLCWNVVIIQTNIITTLKLSRSFDKYFRS